MTEKSGFQHYPKHLYLDGNRTAKDCVVLDEKEEAAARKDGFRMIGEAAPAKAVKDPEQPQQQAAPAKPNGKVKK